MNFSKYLLDHYGDLASVVGLLVTLGGFAATIKKVRQAQKAAEDAKTAAQEALIRIKAQVLVDEVAQCLQFARTIDRSCRAHQWDDAVEACDEVRTLLAKISEHEVIKIDEKESINTFVDQFGSLIEYLVQIKKDTPDANVTKPKSRQLHALITFLGRLQGRLRTQSLEVFQ